MSLRETTMRKRTLLYAVSAVSIGNERVPGAFVLEELVCEKTDPPSDGSMV